MTRTLVDGLRTQMRQQNSTAGLRASVLEIPTSVPADIE